MYSHGKVKMGGLKVKRMGKKTHGAKGRAPISIKRPHKAKARLGRRGY